MIFVQRTGCLFLGDTLRRRAYLFGLTEQPATSGSQSEFGNAYRFVVTCGFLKITPGECQLLCSREKRNCMQIHEAVEMLLPFFTMFLGFLRSLSGVDNKHETSGHRD